MVLSGWNTSQAVTTFLIVRAKRNTITSLALAVTRRRWGAVVAHTVALAGGPGRCETVRVGIDESCGEHSLKLMNMPTPLYIGSGMRLLRQSRAVRSAFRGLRLWATSARVAYIGRMSRTLHRLAMAVHVGRIAFIFAPAEHFFTSLSHLLVPSSYPVLD